VSGQLLVLAKQPVPGNVKTRLCPPCTPREAADIAAAALADTLEAVRRTPAARRTIAFDEPSTVDGFAIIRQRGSGLGARIAHAFADTAGTEPILQVGMDTPQLDPALLAAALDQLDRSDAVLGPAADGGWWALGLHDPALAAALVDVPMSTPDTGRLTAAALERRGARIDYLPQLSDVDTIEDAYRVARSIPDSRFAATLEAISCTAR
jgi:hypothetical protein